MLDYSIGADFWNYFDILIFDAQKPKFMESGQEIPFIDPISEHEICLANLFDSKILTHGNMCELNAYLHDYFKWDFKGLIFEDNFYCGFENKNQNRHLASWDYCLIFRELNEMEHYEECEI